jgi:uncharacterized phage protein gp47/JayE
MSVTAPVGPLAIDDHLEFLPLFPTDDEPTVMQRMIAWANEGLVPDSPRWVDTRPGAHWSTCVVPVAREIARLYDLSGTEVPASAFVLWAWESYLDDHGEALDVLRTAATFAQGMVTFNGPAGTFIAEGFEVGTEPASPDDPAPTFRTTLDATIPDAGGGVGSIDVPILATEVGTAGNVAALAVISPTVPIAGVTFSNAAPTIGGTDTQDDEPYRGRILSRYKGGINWNVRGYEKWFLDRAGVGRVTIIPLWNGPDTVKAVVSDPLGFPVPSSLVDELQRDIDPIPGKGSGAAPVGHVVTVETASVTLITLGGTVEFEEGFSLDGASGTTATRDAIEAALIEYTAAVPSGGEFVYERAKGIVATTLGVHDVGTDFTVNGGTVNVAVPGDPAQVAMLVTPTSFAAGTVA